MSNYCRLSNCNCSCNGNSSSNSQVGNTNILANVPSNLCACNNDYITNNCNVSANNCTNENMLDFLCNCVGRRCTCEFNTNNGLESKSGILERIGEDYLLLRSLNNNRVMYCKTDALMFVTINC